MTNKNENIVAAGCFPAGTKVNTPGGYRFIEDLLVGDEVYAFTLANRDPGMPLVQPGQVFVKKITETFKHFHGVVGETTKLLNISYHGEPEHGYVHDGVLTVSGNHYILTPSKQSEETDEGFARADLLEVGDVMWTEYGDEVIITKIEDGGEYDFVYNFEVEDFHTYIAGGIRVHNGGGGKGSKGAPKQSPNSVQVKQTIRVLLTPGEGEIGGLFNETDPAQSVFFDGTPLKNPDGSYNFDNIAVTERTGLPDQTVIPGFSAVEAEILVGQPITVPVPFTRTVSSAAIDAVRITLEFTNGLQKLDLKSGDANGTSVSFTIQRRIQGGTWETVLSPTVKEMSSGPFAVAGLLQRPDAAGVWEFRVNRVTEDTNLNNIIDKVSMDSYTEIQNANIPYDDRALVAIAVGADSTNGKIPAIALDLMGKLVNVPSNYNPTTRVYSGSWNGTFSPTLQWTNNPAWVIYDLLQHERYGLAAYGFDASRIDVYSFYEAARYCDELVPTAIGSGKFEPRFTFDAQLMVRESAFHTLNTIAATMNAKMYEHAGFIRIAQDRPDVPARLITNSNVVDGMFVYSTSSVEDTYTQVNVTFSDPDSNFLPTTVSEVASLTDRARFDHNVADIAAFGATSEGQARRAAKWVLDTALRQVEMVEFGVSLENAAFEPNEIFYLMDKDYSQTTQEGRLLGTSGTTLILDKAVTMPTGGTWTINVYGANGETIEERTITSRGTTASVVVNSAITAQPGAVYIITGAVKPRQFRLISLVDGDNGTYAVRAVQHDPNKYARVEQGIIVPDEVYWQVPQLTSVDTPTNLLVQPIAAVNADGQVYRQLNVSWTPPADGTAVSYLFQWRRNGQPLTMERPETAFAIVTSDFSGLYEFYVNAVNSAGVTSPTLAGTYDFSFEGDGTGDVAAVTGLRLSNGAAFYSGAMSVVWNAPVTGQVKNYHVYLSTPDGTRFKEFDVTDTGFTYTYDQNVADGGPRAAIQVTVFARDMNNNLGQGLAATFSSQPSAGITNLQVRGGGTVFDTLDLDLTWESRSASGRSYESDPDFAYFNVQVKKGATVSRSVQTSTASFTYSFNDNVKDNGQDTPSNSIIIVVTAYNKLGVASASATATFTPAAPPVVTNLYTKGRTDTIFAEDTLHMTWVANLPNGKPFSASNQFKHFEVQIYNGTTLKRTFKEYQEYASYTAEMNAQDNVSPIFNPRVVIRTQSVYNLTSAPTEATFTNPAPALPSNILITSGIGNYKVSFDRHVDWDVEGTFVWASTTPNTPPSAATLVATMAGDSNYVSINAAAGTKYYVKIAAYDSFRRTLTNGVGLNVSNEVGVTGEAAGILSSATAPTQPPPKVGDVYIDISNPLKPTLKSYNGTVWDDAIGEVAATDIVGQIQNAQIASVATTKLTGTVTDAQIAGVNATKIAGQIVGTQITDNAITTEKINAGAITAGKIGAGQVQAGAIAAGAISTGKLLVTGGGSAINGDPSMKDNTAWFLDGGTINLVADATTPVGGNVMRMTNGGVARSNRFPVVAGVTYKVAFYAKKTSGTGGNYVRVKTFKGDGTSIGDSTGFPESVVQIPRLSPALPVPNPASFENLVVPATWTRYVGRWTAPVGATTAEIDVLANNAGSGVTDYSDVRIEEMVGADLIVDGAISATQIAALTITAGQLAADSVSAVKIQSNAITTDKITANAITGVKILAGEISTDHMKANSITGDRITVNTLVGDRIKAGTLDVNTATAVQILANKIDTRGLTIRDANNNVVFAAGTTVPLGLIPSGALNSNVPIPTASQIGALPSNFKINTSNISTYISGASIGGAYLVDGTITAAQIQGGTITGDRIAANTITTEKITANSISGDQLQVNAVGAKNIAAAAITAVKIGAGAITAEKIDAGAVTAVKIAAGAITADKISAGAIQVGDASITTLKLAGQAVTVPISAYTAAVTSTGSEVGVQDARMVINQQDLVGTSAINILVMFGCHCYSTNHQSLIMSLDFAREYDANNNYVFSGFQRIFSQGGGGNETQMQGEGMEGGQLSQRVTQPGTYLFRLNIGSAVGVAYASKRYVTLLQVKR